MTAAEKAMEDISAALDQFFRGDMTSFEALNAVAHANGAYAINRIGEAASGTQ